MSVECSAGVIDSSESESESKSKAKANIKTQFKRNRGQQLNDRTRACIRSVARVLFYHLSFLIYYLLDSSRGREDWRKSCGVVCSAQEGEFASQLSVVLLMQIR